MELLEHRRLLAFDPTPFEQASLEHLNRMRGNPVEELGYLFSSVEPKLVARDPALQFVVDVFEVNASLLVSQFNALRPVAPLAWNMNLHDSAVSHNLAMAAADQQSHQLPNELPLWNRISDAGYSATTVGENVYAYAATVDLSHAAFAIDWRPGSPGIQNPPRHRMNIMSGDFTEVGIDVYEELSDQTSVGPLLVTQNFGNRNDYESQLVGVAFDDVIDNGWYDPGEGLAGVTIRAEGANGTFTTTTMSAGGYQMPLPPGTYRVIASGPGLDRDRVVSNVIVRNANVKVDFDASMAPTPPPPLAVMDVAVIDERGHVTVAVLNNDQDSSSVLLPNSVIVVKPPQYGDAMPNIFNGRVYYRSDPGFVGLDSFTYQVSNGAGQISNQATVWLRALFATGDFDRNGRVNGSDIDAIFPQIERGSVVPRYDITGDGQVTRDDLDYLVHDVLNSEYGDANLDGRVDTADYEIWNRNRFSADSPGWSRGDFNGDRMVDGSDFLIWLENRDTARNTVQLIPAVIDRAMAAEDDKSTPLADDVDVEINQGYGEMLPTRDDGLRDLLPHPYAIRAARRYIGNHNITSNESTNDEGSGTADKLLADWYLYLFQTSKSLPST